MAGKKLSGGAWSGRGSGAPLAEQVEKITGDKGDVGNRSSHLRRLRCGSRSKEAEVTPGVGAPRRTEVEAAQNRASGRSWSRGRFDRLWQWHLLFSLRSSGVQRRCGVQTSSTTNPPCGLLPSSPMDALGVAALLEITTDRELEVGLDRAGDELLLQVAALPLGILGDDERPPDPIQIGSRQVVVEREEGCCCFFDR